MKKVILFTDNLGSGGAQRQVANVAVLLKKAGYDVSVLVYQDVPFYKHILDENDVPLVLVKSDGTVSRMIGIRKYLKNSCADVVISFLAVPCFIACFSVFFGETIEITAFSFAIQSVESICFSLAPICLTNIVS